ncbi:MAG: hypothetical protein F6K63_31310 [Moorea sp. SIO1G6]|uniref:hypothetical protein n=1 Tax=Moorena sp. SIO1G6 TaxID=2607840 RepID=UPI0013C0A671|nr:hypothetical protein [Moorena sp. SIO1G6]NES81691.1 hypothetical protein [Moorena sp. SIO2B7]NET68643.1 hypothetical protein [Moorena sp. SIO1G6]
MEVLKCEAIEKWTGIAQSHPIIQSLDDIVSWKVVPPFCKIGRSSWLPLEEPIIVEGPCGDIHVEALKIKGVGFLDYDGNIRQPTTTMLPRLSANLGISKEGSFSILPGYAGPIGGITLEKASAEYKTARTLTEKGIPSSVPIRLYKYSDLRYRTKEGTIVPMGVVVTGQLQRTFKRLDTALKYSTADDDETKAELNRFAKKMGVSLSQEPELSLFRASYASYGHHIREFSKCGYYRYSFYPNNLGFSAHRGSAYFTDLDSCRELVECSEIEKPMQVMRDALSAVLYLIIIFVQEPYIHYFSPEQVFQANLQRTFLANYYCDLSIELIDALVEVLNEYHLELYHRAIGSQEQSFPEETDVPSDLPPDLAYQLNHNKKVKFCKSSWLNYEEIYCYLIAVMSVLHSRSQISAIYPFKLTEEELYANMADFGTPQTV